MSRITASLFLSSVVAFSAACVEVPDSFEVSGNTSHEIDCTFCGSGADSFGAAATETDDMLAEAALLAADELGATADANLISWVPLGSDVMAFAKSSDKGASAEEAAAGFDAGLIYLPASNDADVAAGFYAVRLTVPAGEMTGTAELLGPDGALAGSIPVEMVRLMDGESRSLSVSRDTVGGRANRIRIRFYITKVDDQWEACIKITSKK